MRWTEIEAAAAVEERYREEAVVSMQPGGMLAGGNGMWFVRRGSLRLYSVLADGNGNYAQRSHLFDIAQGNVLFGLGEPQTGFPVPGTSVLAVGSGNTELVPIPRSAVSSMAGDPILRHWLTRQLDRWIEAWHDAFTGETGAGAVTENVIRTDGSVRWVHLPESEEEPLRWYVRGLKIPIPRGSLKAFPLGSAGRLANPGAGELTLSDTEAWWSQDPEWAGLDAFHAFTLSILQLLREQETQAEHERLYARSRQDELMLSQAIERLQGVHRRAGLPDAEGAAGNNPLIAAVKAVGNYAGVEVVQPLQMPRGTINQLEAIADASRCRIREVSLTGRWWREDNGPLLAFAESDGRPVALLPSKPGRYRLFDPVDETFAVVTEETAGQLQTEAYLFYKALPSRELKLKDIIRAGMQRGVRRDLAVMLALGAALGLLGLLTPIVTSLLYDNIIPDADRSQLIQVAFILASSAVAVFLFETARGLAMLRIEGRVDLALQAAVWDRLLRLPVSFFRKYTTGDLSMRANSINAIRRKLSGIAVTSFFSGLFSVFYLILLFLYHPGLALLALGLAFVGIAVAVAFSIVQIRYQREFMHQQGQVRSMMVQILSGIAKFRIAAAESRAFYLWAGLFGKQNRIQFQLSKLDSYYAVFQAVYPIATSMVLYYIVAAMGTKSVSTGNFIAFFTAFSALQSGLMAMSSSLLSSLSVVTLYERAKPILQALPEEADGGEHPGTLGGGLEMSHVYFRYSVDGAWTVKDVSLKVRPGAFVAIVGESGSGKSTLLRLMLGFEKPESGTIAYDGKDLARLDLQAVRRQMGVVLQNGGLLAGDLYSNIVGASGLSIDDAWEAARIAGLEADIREMPMGMHTVLPDGGGTLSGGQVQRLLIARAVVRKPKLLFFDEATSALDNRTQAAVSDSLAKLQATRVVIAHRLSTIRHADLIVVMQRGEIVQQGTYEELAAQEGLFAEMARRQMV